MLRRKYISVGLSLLALSLTGPPSVPAQPPVPPDQLQRQRTERCAAAGEGAAGVTRLRDAGVPLSKIMARIDQRRSASSSDPARADTAAAGVRRDVLRIYQNRHWTPAVAQQRIETECFQEGEQP